MVILLKIILLLVCWEVLVRLFCLALNKEPFFISEKKFHYWLKLDEELLFIPKSHYRGFIDDTYVKLNNFGLRGADLGPKKPNEIRILCLGDSVIFGKKLALSQSYSQQLENILTQRFPQKDIKAINGGISAYSLYQGLVYLVRVADQIKPDIVTAGFNFNDRRLCPSEGTCDSQEYFSQTYCQRKRGFRFDFFQEFYLVSFVLSVAKKLFGFPGQSQKEDYYRFSLKDLRPRVPEAEYRRLLFEFIDFSKLKRIGLIFINLGDSPEYSDIFSQGLKLQRENKLKEAILVFKKIFLDKRRCFRSLAHYHLAAIYEALGLKPEAEREFQAIFEENSLKSRFFGGSPIRTDVSYQSIMRSVAQQQDILLVEAASILKAKGIKYNDFCHFEEAGHRLLAEETAKLILEKGMLG